VWRNLYLIATSASLALETAVKVVSVDVRVWLHAIFVSILGTLFTREHESSRGISPAATSDGKS
jgi:hypothetical protein